MTGRGMVDSIFKSHKEYLESLELKVAKKEIFVNYKYSEIALADKYFTLFDKDDNLIKIISNLKVHNWYTSQNPAMELLFEQDLNKLEESTENADKLFVLGRNIYQAACGNAEKPLEFLKNLNIHFSKYSDFVINHIYNGMLYEIYFDSNNDIREKPKTDYQNDILLLDKNPRLKENIEFINTTLAIKNRL